MARPVPDQPVRRSVVATPDPPAVGIANPIHDEDGATSAGYAGALVAGVRTYGWAAEVVVEALGAEWLDDGWADVTLRRPVFAGDLVNVVVEASEAGTGAVIVTASVGERVVLEGTAGRGAAAWLDGVQPPPAAPAQEPPPLRPTYAVDSAPLGQPLRPLGAYVTADAARHLALDDLGLEHTAVPDGRVHPWFLAARMAPLTRHNFTYGPTIHVRTQIQHVGPAAADQELVIGAQIVDVYERKLHWYQVLDGSIVGASGRPGAPEIARLRHHTIFRPRGTTTPPPIAGSGA
jgi:hypothetical protein